MVVFAGKLFHVWERAEKRQWWLALANLLQEDLRSLLEAEERNDKFGVHFHHYLVISGGSSYLGVPSPQSLSSNPLDTIL